MDENTTRRKVLRAALASAAAAATTASFLRAASAQSGEAELPLRGGGKLIAREQDGRWTATVIGPEGQRRPSPTGTVVLENGQKITVEKGRVVDSGAEMAGFSLFIDFSAPAPDIAQQPVLDHQAELLKTAPALRPDLKPRVQPDLLKKPRLQKN